MQKKSKTILFYAIVAPFFLYSNTLLADNGSAHKFVEKGDREFSKSNLQKALVLYLKAMAIDSTDSYTNFQVGAIYYLSDSNKLKSLPYFLNTIKYSGPGEDDTIIDAYYYIGNCYALQKNYPASVIAFNKYIRHIDPKSRVDESVMQEVKHYIEIYTQAPQIINRNPDSSGYFIDNRLHPVYVRNLGPVINSPYPEYSQVMLNHDSTIIFTSRRPASHEGKKDFMTDQYYEDIFISHLDSTGHWLTPEIFSNQLRLNVGKEVDLASVAVTSDGHTLFIYSKNSIWETHLQSGTWTKPERIGKNIRQIRHFIPSVFLSYDGTKLFLACERNGGYGGKDIYESEKNNNGTWSEPQNLGPEINTSFDEDAPFLMPDNKTLFFSSKGHTGLGGYDIFKSVYEDGKWSEPENIGPPVNSAGDDIYFTYDTSLHEGFFSSSRAGGYGGMDIYSFNFICDNIQNTMLQGEIVSNAQNIKGAAIFFTDSKSHKSNTVNPDEKGKYSISLQPERNYRVEIKIPGYLPYRTSFSTPHQCNAYNLYQEINPSFVTDSLYVHTGQNLIVKNAFYHNAPQGTNFNKVNNDTSLNAFIHSFNDTATIWEKVTALSITFTKAQKDSMNPRIAVAINQQPANNPQPPANNQQQPVNNPQPLATVKMLTASSIPKMPVVYFRFNSYAIDYKYFSKLDSIAGYMKMNKDCKVMIEGNTDTVGRAAYNQLLSVWRANAVAKYLIKKGVSKSRIQLQGNGIHHLAVVGDGANARNRRDDILIMKE